MFIFFLIDFLVVTPLILKNKKINRQAIEHQICSKKCVILCVTKVICTKIRIGRKTKLDINHNNCLILNEGLTEIKYCFVYIDCRNINKKRNIADNITFKLVENSLNRIEDLLIPLLFLDPTDEY